MPNANVNAFLKHIKIGLKRYGIRPPVERPADLEKMILSAIAEVYCLSVRVIRTSNRRGVVVESKTMAIILLHKHTKATQAELADQFNRTESLICKRLVAFRAATQGQGSDKMFAQARFQSNYKIVNEKIIMFKNTQLSNAGGQKRK